MAGRPCGWRLVDPPATSAASDSRSHPKAPGKAVRRGRSWSWGGGRPVTRPVGTTDRSQGQELSIGRHYRRRNHLGAPTRCSSMRLALQDGQRLRAFGDATTERKIRRPVRGCHSPRTASKGSAPADWPALLFAVVRHSVRALMKHHRLRPVAGSASASTWSQVDWTGDPGTRAEPAIASGKKTWMPPPSATTAQYRTARKVDARVPAPLDGSDNARQDRPNHGDRRLVSTGNGASEAAAARTTARSGALRYATASSELRSTVPEFLAVSPSPTTTIIFGDQVIAFAARRRRPEVWPFNALAAAPPTTGRRTTTGEELLVLASASSCAPKAAACAPAALTLQTARKAGDVLNL